MGRWGAVLVGMLAGACGGDDSGDPLKELRVVEVTPSDGATDVEPGAAVVIRFNRSLDPTTVEGAVLIRDAPADVVVEGDTVTLTPRDRLAHLQEYEVRAELDVLGVEGDRLVAPHRSVFTTRSRRWERRDYLGDGAIGAILGSRDPQLAGLPDGRVVALWQHGTDGALGVAWSVYRPDDDAWSSPAPLGQSTTPMEPQLASNGLGEVVAVWIEEASLKSTRYDEASDDFEESATVHIDDNYVARPAVAISSNGDAAVAFDSSNGVRVHRQPAAGGWSGEQVVSQGLDPAVAVGGDGTVWVAWISDGGVIARVFDGLTWGEPQPLWSGGEDRAYRVRIAPWPSNGGAIATWGVELAAGGEVHVRAHQFGDWGDDEIIGTSSIAEPPQSDIATAVFGDVLVVWYEGVELCHTRWWRDGSWQPVVSFTDDIVDLPSHPLALDGEGNAIVTYSSHQAAYYLAAQDLWTESTLPLETARHSAAFSGTDPVLIGDQPTSIEPHIVVTFYR